MKTLPRVCSIAPFALALLVLAMSLIFGPAAHAARFANQFIEFELPPQWQCQLEGAEWVCQSTNEAKKRDALIVLAAKLKGDQDSIDQYLAHLKGPKLYTSVMGKQIRSEPTYAKTVSIDGQPWVDALHLESEIPGFYTRYLATIKLDIGVLVTYSINKTKYKSYLADFENMVRTLKVFRKPGGLNQGNSQAPLMPPPQLSDQSVFSGITPPAATEQPKPKPQDDSTLIIIAVIAAGAGYLYWRRKQSGH